MPLLLFQQVSTTTLVAVIFYLYIRERTLNISRQCERNHKTKIARKAFLLSFVRSYQANRTKELFSLVSLSAADINATSRLSVRSYRTTNVSTFWNASLWQSSSYQNEIIIQPEAIKWNRSKNNHFVMQFFLYIYIYIFRFKKKIIIRIRILYFLTLRCKLNLKHKFETDFWYLQILFFLNQFK